MRLLLDANLSPRLIGTLVQAGFDSLHVGDLGLLTASDTEIFDRAAADGLVVVTADSDFPMLLAHRRGYSRWCFSEAWPTSVPTCTQHC